MDFLLEVFDTSEKAPTTLCSLSIIYASGLARDKLWKFVQNFSRFLFYILTIQSTKSSSSYILETSEWFKNVWKSVSTARKGFRLGKSILHANKMHIYFNDQRRYFILKCIHTVQRSFLFFHEFFDNCVWLTSCNLIATKNKMYYKQQAYSTKFFGEAFGMLLHVVELHHIKSLVSENGNRNGTSSSSRDDLTKLKSKKLVEKNVIKKQKAKIIRAMAKGFPQMLAAFINANYGTRFFGWEKNDGVLSVCGMVNAIVCLFDYWPNITVPVRKKEV